MNPDPNAGAQQQTGGQPASDQGQAGHNYQVHIDDKTRSGKYANAVSVHVNRNEVVIDFGYIQPGQGQNRIDVVSRVNLNHDVAKSFMSLLQDAILDFQNRLKEHEQKQQQQEGGAPQA